ncbi:MAG: DNA replication/repair protein RecF [Xanthomonadales bacterium]|nr:DNA replication/repair protein RecF [Xanthomonadales bacterium]
MFIKTIKINNIRNLFAVEIEAHPKLNLLIGRNGAGKTSVLEAMVILAKGRSFRSGQAPSLIGPGGEKVTVFASTEDHRGVKRSLGIERDSRSWTARLNGQDVAQLGDLAVHMPMVVMEPNSHLLISGPPEARRRYLDWGVFHVEPDHLLSWRRYNRTLKQRNAALKRRQRGVIQSLDPVLTKLGEKIDKGRRVHFDQLMQTLSGVSGQLSTQLPEMVFDYTGGWSGDSLSESLAESTERDMERGQTGPGPHRADVTFKVNGQAARDQLSRGEQKILAASLLLSQLVILGEQGNKPLLLLDDIASEFDTEHLNRLMSFGAALGCQMWVTGTSPDPFAEHIAREGAVFHVEQGEIARKTNT